VAERFADGEARAEDLEAARGAAAAAAQAALLIAQTPGAADRAEARVAEAEARAASWAASAERTYVVAGAVAWAAGDAAARADEIGGRGGGAGGPPEHQAQADLLREVFGNPFRPSPPLPAAVLAWSDGIVVRLAQALYEARDFSNIALLADALSDAGCADEALLAHCRSGGEHVRGCWAVDAVLGKS
jgi:hypothetical protein